MGDILFFDGGDGSWSSSVGTLRFDRNPSFYPGVDQRRSISKWADASNVNMGSTFAINGRRGQSCLLVQESGFVRTPNFTPGATRVVGFAHSMHSGGSGWRTVAEFREGNIVHMALQININTFRARMSRGGTAPFPDTANNAVTTQTWNARAWSYLEARVTVGPAGSYKIRCNNKDIWTQTNVNTQNGGTGVIDNVRILSSTGAWVLDDAYVESANFRGVCLIETLTVSNPGTGANTGWSLVGGATPIACIDDGGEGASAMSDSDYIEARSPGTKSTFDMNNLTLNASMASILGIQPVYITRINTAGGKTLGSVYRQGGVDYNFGSRVMVGGGTLDAEGWNAGGYVQAYHTVTQPLFVNPHTGAAFVVADINAMEIGPRVIA